MSVKNVSQSGASENLNSASSNFLEQTLDEDIAKSVGACVNISKENTSTNQEPHPLKDNGSQSFDNAQQSELFTDEESCVRSESTLTESSDESDNKVASNSNETFKDATYPLNQEEEVKKPKDECVTRPNKKTRRFMSGTVRSTKRLVTMETAISEKSDHDRQMNLNRGIRRFNLNPKKGLKYLQDIGIIKAYPDDRIKNAQEIAHFLYNTRGLNKESIGKVLGEDDPNLVLALKEYIDLFDFEEFGATIHGVENGLRKLLSFFKPPGESQKIDRILEFFSRKFILDNMMHSQECEFNPESTIIISYLIIMLNVDLHNPNNPRRMTKKQFIDRCKDLDMGKDLPHDSIAALYDRVLTTEIKHTLDRDDLAGNLYTNPDKCGWLFKKGSTIWRRRWFLLSDNTLYYFKSREDVEPLGWIPLENVVILSDFMERSERQSKSDPGRIRERKPVRNTDTHLPQARAYENSIASKMQELGKAAPFNNNAKQEKSFFGSNCRYSSREMGIGTDAYNDKTSKTSFSSYTRLTSFLKPANITKRKAFCFEICSMDPCRKWVKSVKVSRKKAIVLGNHKYIQLRADSRQDAECWIRVLTQKNIITESIESIRQSRQNLQLNSSAISIS